MTTLTNFLSKLIATIMPSPKEFAWDEYRKAKNMGIPAEVLASSQRYGSIYNYKR